jgi:hypothetical protein
VETEARCEKGNRSNLKKESFSGKEIEIFYRGGPQVAALSENACLRQAGAEDLTSGLGVKIIFPLSKLGQCSFGGLQQKGIECFR